MKKRIYALILCVVLVFSVLTSCDFLNSGASYIKINEEKDVVLTLGQTKQLSCDTDALLKVFEWYTSSECVNVEDGLVTAISEGVATVTVKCGELSDSITVRVEATKKDPPESVEISLDKSEISVGEHIAISFTVYPLGASTDIGFEVLSGDGVIDFIGNTAIGSYAGTVEIVGKIDGVISNTLTLTVVNDIENIYSGMSEDEFYLNYTPATSNTDALYRTQNGFMSGTLTVPDQAPTISANRPTKDGLFVKNTSMYFSEGGKAYSVLDASGNIAFTVYKDGAYITLEEVAAYVFAFGDVPKNYTSSKKTDPDNSIWGEYLRLNHSKFSGSTKKYPYEPKLPNISGCGGTYSYYEIDIGTTGTDCDPSYNITIYNNGSTITRGAARIVYARFDINGDKIIDPDEKHVFYTYNHYNDFQEYLNYLGGWGEMFGNISGGGTLSSKYDYNPTPYIPTYNGTVEVSIVVILLPYYDNKQMLI